MQYSTVGQRKVRLVLEMEGYLGNNKKKIKYAPDSQ